MRTRRLGGLWVPEHLLPPKTIRMFGPETAIFAPKFDFLGTYRPGWLIWCPVGWLIGGCGAGFSYTKASTYFLNHISSTFLEKSESGQGPVGPV